MSEKLWLHKHCHPIPFEPLTELPVGMRKMRRYKYHIHSQSLLNPMQRQSGWVTLAVIILNRQFL